MARSGVRDPLDKFRWTVSIEGFSKLGFMTCSTPEVNLQVRSYSEGGNHLNPRKIVDGASYTPITLTRGVTNDTSFAKWINGIFDAHQNDSGFDNTTDDPITSPATAVFNAASNNGAKPVRNLNGDLGNYRKTIKIEHVNRNGQVEVAYFLYNAFPVSYKPASDFDATADDGVSIESITIEYEGFETKYTGLAGAAANIITKSIL